ncbi:MAG TPA: S-layer homology domain-containing protein [Acidobacteria bacterium]|nr:S-layer homology domain-containing protein [Acidobacteriota bacterium]
MTYDNSDPGSVRLFWIKESCPGNAPCHETVLLDVATDHSGTPGYSGPFVTFDVPVTWHNTDRSTEPNEIVSSFVRVYFSEGGTDLRAGPLVLWYRRQISSAPATATFPDVPTDHWAFQYIEALAASGITQGFPDGTFRPTSPVTRAQMATFLSRALGLHWGD